MKSSLDPQLLDILQKMPRTKQSARKGGFSQANRQCYCWCSDVCLRCTSQGCACPSDCPCRAGPERCFCIVTRGVHACQPTCPCGGPNCQRCHDAASSDTEANSATTSASSSNDSTRSSAATEPVGCPCADMMCGCPCCRCGNVLEEPWPRTQRPPHCGCGCLCLQHLPTKFDLDKFRMTLARAKGGTDTAGPSSVPLV